MYVCNCHGIPEDEMSALIRKYDKAILKDVLFIAGVFGCCGKCIPRIKEIFNEQRNDSTPTG